MALLFDVETKLIGPIVTMDPRPAQKTQKAQPWKAGWVARNAAGVEKKAVGGTSHGAAAGEIVILGGHTSGVSVKVNPEKAE